MSASFYERPILNSPYEPPLWHHHLDDEGQPLDLPPIPGRRRSKLITPVPKARKSAKKAGQASLVLADVNDLSTADQEYNPTPIINEIRTHVEAWRAIPNPKDWGVTPATARLLQHWRHPRFEGVRPFFCQVEAVETAIWLAEVARPQRRYKPIWDHLRGANEQSNPDLLRIALKMATGSGKTTVMAMLIAWQTVNAVRSPNSSLFSRGFLIVTPGITIKDRLRVLLTNDAENYYEHRELVPLDLLPEIRKAKIVITNYHAFKRRETLDVSKVGRSLLQGRGTAPVTLETEGAMLARCANELMGLKGVAVINDEAHHCYREKPGGEEKLTGDDREEAKRNREAARLWISGLEAVQRKLGVTTVYDLSATPFFLRGSGYAEGTLFPWTCSDFSLMDAIESGIVKLPRFPVSDNMVNSETLTFRHLWEHIGKEMPKAGASKGVTASPFKLPSKLQTALWELYGHYKETFEQWGRENIPVPPVFIVVCNNTAASQLVYEWISGFERPAEGEQSGFHEGRLELFRNYDPSGGRLASPRTLLIDSQQLESGEALDRSFADAFAPQIAEFKRERRNRMGQAEAEDVSDQELLREVMNTVGKQGKLGEGIRCVVSVSMLTEGWDVNTVTHILGVRAFGTQLLCEQVVGRALRRQNYDLNEHGLFNAEYADILGVPFAFSAQPVVAKPIAPKIMTRVQAVPAREALEIVFPRVEGYRVELPNDRVTAVFNADSVLELTPELVGPAKVRMEAIVGAGVTLDLDVLDDTRPNALSFAIAKRLVYRRFSEPGQPARTHLFPGVQRIARRWVNECLVCKGETKPAMVLYEEIMDKACDRIELACRHSKSGGNQVRAILDPYTPTGSSRFVGFSTTKEVYTTNAARCHVNAVVLDSGWEAEFARAAEDHPRVLAYVKNQGMQFEAPYRDGAEPRRYRPDFIVRVDDGRDEPLNLVVEIKGFRAGDAQLKAETMRKLWVPGVNALGAYGRWEFAEFTDVFEIEAAFGKLIGTFLAAAPALQEQI
jgi:type III restriction enzyme